MRRRVRVCSEWHCESTDRKADCRGGVATKNQKVDTPPRSPHYTDGDTIEEVKANLREAIQLYLEVS